MLTCTIPFVLLELLYQNFKKKSFKSFNKMLSLSDIDFIVEKQSELSQNGLYILENVNFIGCKDKGSFLYNVLCEEIRYLRLSKFIEIKEESFGFIENNFTVEYQSLLFYKINKKINSLNIKEDETIQQILYEINKKLKV